MDNVEEAERRKGKGGTGKGGNSKGGKGGGQDGEREGQEREGQGERGAGAAGLLALEDLTLAQVELCLEVGGLAVLAFGEAGHLEAHLPRIGVDVDEVEGAASAAAWPAPCSLDRCSAPAHTTPLPGAGL